MSVIQRLLAETLYPIQFALRLQDNAVADRVASRMRSSAARRMLRYTAICAVLLLVCTAVGPVTAFEPVAEEVVAAETVALAAMDALGLQPAGVVEDAKNRRERVLKLFVDELISIQPGEGQFPKEFKFGSKTSETDASPRAVEMKEPFSIAKYEVTQELWGVVMQNNPSKWKGPRNSAEMFTAKEAAEFCKRLTAELHTDGLLPGEMEVRLPTELEWEYCCRAGTETEYSFGDSASQPDDSAGKTSLFDQYGWHTGNAAGNDPPVGAKKPNPWGLYDVHGYLWEICSDEWTTDAKPPAGKSPAAATAVADEPAGSEPDSATSKTELKTSASGKCVIRGGSWKDKVDQCRSSSRRSLDRSAADDAVGLRCVCAKIR